MNNDLLKQRTKLLNDLFPPPKPVTTNKVTTAIKRCRLARKNGNNYRCCEHWCKECNKYKWDELVQDSLSFVQKELDAPAFATVLIKFIKSPNNTSHKRITNQAIKQIQAIGIKGVWYPEIAFKHDKPKQIDGALIGYSAAKPYLLHIHGIISLSDKAKLRAIFPIKKQTEVTEIGIGSYACMSLDQNIINVIRYSTKKDWKSADAPIIEANADGFGRKLT